MTIARKLIMNDALPGAYHLISRCVRRAFLCGDAAEHRRAWLEQGIASQAQAFAVEVLTFAVMSNHFHLVVRTDPQQTGRWSAREVVERWSSLFPTHDPETGVTLAWEPALIDSLAMDAAWVEVRRKRLASVSWFMRLLKQRIARKANAEDHVTGHFWEGRFISVALLDQAAVLSCMAYVDLNPIRAGLSATPEASDHTGVQRRIQARQEFRKAQALLDASCDGRATETNHRRLDAAHLAVRQGPEHGLWIAPCLRATGGHCLVDDYLDLIDQTGRLLRGDKRGAIPAHLAPILKRLQIDVDSWLSVMLSHGRFLGTAVGAVAQLIGEAARRGVKWIADKTGIHRDRRLRPTAILA